MLIRTITHKIYFLYLFFYLGFNIDFTTVWVISRQVVLWAEKTSTYKKISNFVTIVQALAVVLKVRNVENLSYRVRNLKFATYLKFATCENTNNLKINEL